MIPRVQPFRNQRSAFLNAGTTYGDKPTHNARGLFPSRKSGRQIHFWTQSELDFIKLLETAKTVRAFEARPGRVALRRGPTWFHYVPHFRVDLFDRTIVVELSRLGRPTTARKAEVAALAATHYRREGIVLVGLAHCVYRSSRCLDEANIQLRYLSATPKAEEVLRVHERLWLGPRPIRETATAAGVPIGIVFAMLRMGELSRVSTDKLCNESRVGLPMEARR